MAPNGGSGAPPPSQQGDAETSASNSPLPDITEGSPEMSGEEAEVPPALIEAKSPDLDGKRVRAPTINLIENRVYSDWAMRDTKYHRIDRESPTKGISPIPQVVAAGNASGVTWSAM
ncbi:hypothetical protein MMC25_006819 [Agyrium rufum]|nr:hypothetical protein [Agyrium rufum]